ncbi:hypothetical protein KJ765_04335 [Candidatus Micrarchaeota archaeon]|nr:hypothetical protein [Candidatus Micrarchaeota archaeon]
MRPRKSLQFAFPYAKRSVDVSFWEGREKDGKPLSSSVSMRMRRDGIEGSESVYFKPADALKMSTVLQHYAFEALEHDAERRKPYWQQQKEAGQ